MIPFLIPSCERATLEKTSACNFRLTYCLFEADDDSITLTIGSEVGYLVDKAGTVDFTHSTNGTNVTLDWEVCGVAFSQSWTIIGGGALVACPYASQSVTIEVQPYSNTFTYNVDTPISCGTLNPSFYVRQGSSITGTLSGTGLTQVFSRTFNTLCQGDFSPGHYIPSIPFGTPIGLGSWSYSATSSVEVMPYGDYPTGTWVDISGSFSHDYEAEMWHENVGFSNGGFFLKVFNEQNRSDNRQTDCKSLISVCTDVPMPHTFGPLQNFGVGVGTCMMTVVASSVVECDDADLSAFPPPEDPF